jgi:hypothetical protein
MNDLSNTSPARKSWLVDSDAAPQKAPPNLAMQIMNIMEQGIIEWSAVSLRVKLLASEASAIRF